MKPQLTLKKALGLSQTFESSIQDAKNPTTYNEAENDEGWVDWVQLMQLYNNRSNAISVEGRINIQFSTINGTGYGGTTLNY